MHKTTAFVTSFIIAVLVTWLLATQLFNKPVEKIDIVYGSILWFILWKYLQNKP